MRTIDLIVPVSDKSATAKYNITKILHLVQGEYAVVDIPILHVYEPMGSVGYAIDGHLDLLGTFGLRVRSDGCDDLLYRHDRSKDVRASGERYDASFRRNQREKVFDLEADRIWVIQRHRSWLPEFDDYTTSCSQLLPWTSIGYK